MPEGHWLILPPGTRGQRLEPRDPGLGSRYGVRKVVVHPLSMPVVAWNKLTLSPVLATVGPPLTLPMGGGNQLFYLRTCPAGSYSQHPIQLA